jgi:hypothetical protein
MDIAIRSGWAASASAKEGPSAVSKAGVANRLRRERLVMTLSFPSICDESSKAYAMFMTFVA